MKAVVIGLKVGLGIFLAVVALSLALGIGSVALIAGNSGADDEVAVTTTQPNN